MKIIRIQTPSLEQLINKIFLKHNLNSVNKMNALIQMNN